jgi:Ca2+-transporting ATPase
MPLLPIHLLWINLVTDGLPALALAYERAETDLMRRPPRRSDESIFAGGLIRDILVFGTMMGLACFGLFVYILLRQTSASDLFGDEAYARTAVFVALAMFQLWYVLGLRATSRSILQSPPWKNWRLAGAFVLGTVLQIVLVYVPFMQSIFHTVSLRLVDLILCIAFPATALVLHEIIKFFRRPRELYRTQ